MSQADTSTMANALHAIDLAPTERYHLLAADRRLGGRYRAVRRSRSWYAVPRSHRRERRFHADWE